MLRLLSLRICLILANSTDAAYDLHLCQSQCPIMNFFPWYCSFILAVPDHMVLYFDYLR